MNKIENNFANLLKQPIHSGYILPSEAPTLERIKELFPKISWAITHVTYFDGFLEDDLNNNVRDVVFLEGNYERIQKIIANRPHHCIIIYEPDRSYA
ncbi:MAG: hypothetical protein IJ571_06065 [Ruminococcus sp.]|nr:hypothetical protein [Ruminococcus sp.]